MFIGCNKRVEYLFFLSFQTKMKSLRDDWERFSATQKQVSFALSIKSSSHYGSVHHPLSCLLSSKTPHKLAEHYEQCLCESYK